ncbi:MAG: LLM class flavin-dependent oxidoreductase [Actinomycetota bacterium]|nr:LLM class flavin-dependent oxidoreductase [Actinomycetota bacterium]
MRVDANFYGSVPMRDAGNAGPVPVDRRYGNDAFLGCYDNLISWAGSLDELGYDTMWLTEHHFQYEGYEVVPNLVQFGLFLTTRTERLRAGQMFNVVPQWHPLRLAEDYAMAQILSNDRMQFGVGRGTVPREAQSLGGVVASGDNEMSREADRLNREIFEESMEIIRLAWTNERFSFTGKHFTLPPPGIPDRGATVTDLTLVPKPISPVDIWQPVTSPATLEYCPSVRHHGVIPARPPAQVKEIWDRYGELAAGHGWELAPGEGRCLALNVHIGRTREDAFRTGRDPHDEWCRFLAPYGRFRSYANPAGGETPFDFQPALEDSVDQQIMAIGSVEDVAEAVGMWHELLGMEHLVLFFDMPGISREAMVEQFHLFADEVMPRAGLEMTRSDVGRGVRTPGPPDMW